MFDNVFVTSTPIYVDHTAGRVVVAGIKKTGAGTVSTAAPVNKIVATVIGKGRGSFGNQGTLRIGEPFDESLLRAEYELPQGKIDVIPGVQIGSL